MIENNNGLFQRELWIPEFMDNTMRRHVCWCTYSVGNDGKPAVKMVADGQVTAVRPMTEAELEQFGLTI